MVGMHISIALYEILPRTSQWLISRYGRTYNLLQSRKGKRQAWKFGIRDEKNSCERKVGRGMLCIAWGVCFVHRCFLPASLWCRCSILTIAQWISLRWSCTASRRISRTQNTSSALQDKGTEGCPRSHRGTFFSTRTRTRTSSQNEGFKPGFGGQWRILSRMGQSGPESFRVDWFGLPWCPKVRFCPRPRSGDWKYWNLPRLYANDRVDTYVALYEHPTPSSVDDVTHLQWRGLLHPAFVGQVLDTLM